MNKKLFMISTVLMAITMLSSPVLAIGPQNAGNSNNPNIEFTYFSVQLFLPNGMVTEWITEDPSHVQIKSAQAFYIGNAIEPSSASEFVYNRWNFLSEDVFQEFLESPDIGFDPDLAYYISHVVWAGGVYFKEVYTGK